MTHKLKFSRVNKIILSETSSSSGFLRFDTIGEQLSMTASGKRCARSILKNLPLLFSVRMTYFIKKINLNSTNIVKSVIFRLRDRKRSAVTTICNPDFNLFYQKE